MKNLNKLISESIKSSLYQILNEDTNQNQTIENFFQKHIILIQEELDALNRFKQFFLEVTNMITNYLSSKDYLLNVENDHYEDNLLVTFNTNIQLVKDSDEYYDTSDDIENILLKQIKQIDLNNYTGEYHKLIELGHNLDNNNLYFELVTKVRKNDYSYYI